MSALVVSSALLALVGGAHCLAMCGGLSCMASSTGTEVLHRTTVLHVGRIGAYMVLGALASLWSAAAVKMVPEMGAGLRLVAALLIIYTGLKIAGFVQLRASANSVAQTWGKVLTGRMQALRERAQGLGALGDLLLGALWGLLPCGFVYSALMLAVAAKSTSESVATMAAFGLGTLPWLLATNAVFRLAPRLIATANAKRAAGLALATLGVVGAAFALHALTERRCCDPAEHAVTTLQLSQ